MNKYETHRKTGTVEYNTWGAMKSRCYNGNQPSYKDYGGRGITVCDRWRDSFTNFFSDMGLRPSPSHQIDRIDNDGNYEPSNCRWATRSENQRNKGNNVLTDEQVRDIRRRHLEGESNHSLARDYPCSRQTIIRIVNNKKWVVC